MFTRLLTGALFAGVVAGCLGAVLQLVFVVPLIAQGERYETGALVHFGGAAEVAAHDHAPGTPEDHDHPAPAEVEGDGHDHATGVTEGDGHDHAPAPAGAGRTLGNVAMFLVTYTGFALVMVAGFALAERTGHRVTARTGAIWGLAGFIAVQLAPAFGLAPELPGSVAGELQARQLWWAFCVLATGAGIAALAFGRGVPWLGLGVLLIALPHLVGAPMAAPGGVAPPELAAHFAARVLGAGAAAWVMLGTVAGAFWSRQG